MSKIYGLNSTTNPEAVRQVRVRPSSAISDRKRKQALMLFEKGFGYRSVANLLGISEYTIRDWSRKYKKGEFVPKLSRRCYRYPDTVKKLVVDLRKEGRTWKQIGEQTGVKSTTARAWVEQWERIERTKNQKKDSL